MREIKIQFETEGLCDKFLGWMSDGGGEQEFNMLEHLADFEYGSNGNIIVSKPNHP